MAKLSKDDFRIRYELFDKFAVKDQESYYQYKIKQSEKSAEEVNFIRASLALVTGFASAIAGAIAQAYIVGDCGLSPFYCSVAEGAVIFFIIISILLPAIGGLFSSLSDLYQWERLSTIYDAAERNLLVADSMSPHREDKLDTYIASLYAYVKGTLQVMSDETSQWGQAIREPEGIQTFIDDAKERAAPLGGDASTQTIGFVDNEENSEIILPESDDSDSDTPDTQI